MPVEKRPFLNNLGLFFGAREKIINNFQSKAYSMENLDKTPTPFSTPE